MLPELSAAARKLIQALASFRHLRAEARPVRHRAAAGLVSRPTPAERRRTALRLLRAACDATGHGLRATVSLRAAGRDADLAPHETALAADWLLDRDLLVATDPDGEHVRITEDGIAALEDAGIETRRREPETASFLALGAGQHG